MKKVVSLMLVVVLMFCIFVGCAKSKVKDEDVAKTAAEAMSKLDSFEAEFKFETTIDVEANGAQMSVPININGVLDNLKKENAAYMSLKMEFMGQKQDMELYAFMGDNTTTSYIKEAESDKFVKQVSESKASKADIEEISKKLNELIAKWKWDVKEEKEIYILSHTLIKDEIKELVDAFNSLAPTSEDPEEGIIYDIAPSNVTLEDFENIKVTLEVAKESYYINKVVIDLSDAVKKAMESMMDSITAEGGKVNFSGMLLEIVFGKFNSVASLEPPKDYIEGSDPIVLTPPDTEPETESETEYALPTETNPVSPTETNIEPVSEPVSGALNVNDAPLGEVDIAFKFNDKEYNFNSITPVMVLADGMNDVSYLEGMTNPVESWTSRIFTFAMGEDAYSSSAIEFMYSNMENSACDFKDCHLYAIGVCVGDYYDAVAYGETFEVCGIHSGMSVDEVKAILGEPNYQYNSSNNTYSSFSYELTDRLDFEVYVSPVIGAYEFQISYMGD